MNDQAQIHLQICFYNGNVTSAEVKQGKFVEEGLGCTRSKPLMILKDVRMCNTNLTDSACSDPPPAT